MCADENSGLRASVTQQSSAIADLENGASALYSINAASGSSNAAINVRTQAGQSSEIDLIADSVNVADPDDPDNAVKLFDSNGIIQGRFVRKAYFFRDQHVDITADNTSVAQTMPEFTFMIEADGLYKITFIGSFSIKSDATDSTKSARLWFRRQDGQPLSIQHRHLIPLGITI